MQKKSKKTNKATAKSGYSRARMLKQQEEFYRAHSNARPLLLSFLILALLFGFLYYVKFGFVLIS